MVLNKKKILKNKIRLLPLFIVLVIFIFSIWLFSKSFQYDSNTNEFIISRHQVADFGFHLSLIRSFSWGDNWGFDTPQFPGETLNYHYAVYLLAGIMERTGVRIDYALNSISVIAYTILILYIYKLSQTLFDRKILTGLLSIGLVMLNSSLSYISFFSKVKGSVSEILRQIWYLPDYIHKGPFDGSEITIFFTTNVLLNQRHLIAALAICFGLYYYVVNICLQKKNASYKAMIMLGLMVGVLSRVHVLIMGTSLFVFSTTLLLFRRPRHTFIFGLIGIITALLLLDYPVNSTFANHIKLHIGFLTEDPVTVFTFLRFWILNLGLVFVLFPLSLFFVNKDQRKIAIPFLLLFVGGNLIQVSVMPFHNHALFQPVIIFSIIYTSYILTYWYEKSKLAALAVMLIIPLLTFSGVLNIMAVKNDYRLRLPDAPNNETVQWIKTHTNPNDIFIAPEEFFDPVTLSGRKNYLGHRYYLSERGYDTTNRAEFVKNVYEAEEEQAFIEARSIGIRYLVIPKEPPVDFPYAINADVIDSTLRAVYGDDVYLIYSL